MKYLYFLITYILITITATAQQPIENWSGILNAGGQKIELRVHLIQAADKTFTSNWDVPLQKVKWIPTRVHGHSLV